MRFFILSIVCLLAATGAAFGEAASPAVEAPDSSSVAELSAPAACSVVLPSSPIEDAVRQARPSLPPNNCEDLRACSRDADCGWDSGSLGRCLPASHHYCPGYACCICY